MPRNIEILEATRVPENNVMPEARRPPVIQRDPGARMSLGTSGMPETKWTPETRRAPVSNGVSGVCHELWHTRLLSER